MSTSGRQAEQAMRNLLPTLRAIGVELTDVVRSTDHVAAPPAD